MLSTTTLDNWAKLTASWAESKPAISEVWFFGSRVRGDNRPESDLDVAIVVGGETPDACYTTWHFAAEDWSLELNSILPVKVDLDLGNSDISTKIVGPALDREGIRVFVRSKEA